MRTLGFFGTSSLLKMFSFRLPKAVDVNAILRFTSDSALGTTEPRYVEYSTFSITFHSIVMLSVSDDITLRFLTLIFIPHFEHAF